MTSNMTTSKMHDILSRAKKIEIDAWTQTQRDTFGDYSSKFRYKNSNSGIEFSEVREYTTGDDPRRIDWNVSARYNRLYVKEFTEENDINVYVVIDSSDSTTFGSKYSKKDIILEIGASLVLSALHNNSKNIGLGTFSENLDVFIPAKKGRLHAMKIIHKMIQQETEQYKQKYLKTDLAASISQLADKIKHKSIIFIISDYITKPFAEKMRLLSKSHMVIIIDISDKHEITMPDMGYAYLEDAETGEQILVDTSKKEFQCAYTQMAQNITSDTKRQAQIGKATYVSITDNEPYNITLNRRAKTMIKNIDKLTGVRMQSRAV